MKANMQVHSSAWKCPTCSKWVRCEIGKRCTGCKAARTAVVTKDGQ